MLFGATEDDDADQLDYGDEAGGEGARHNKVVGGVVNKQPPIKKKQHDSVMLIPKWRAVSVTRSKTFHFCNVSPFLM